MVSQILDLTSDFNANNGIKIDVSLWQNCTIQITGSPSGTINITGSNDAGSVQGVSDGSAVSSLNYTAVQVTNLASGAAVTSISAAGNYKYVVATKFIQVGGASAATTGKVIVFLNTPT